MRVIAGLSLLLACVTHLVVGAGLLLSSELEELEARTDAADLSQVASDLVDDSTLAKERAAGKARADTATARRKLVLGISLLAVALGLATGAVLLLLGRARGAVLAIIGLALVATVVVLVLSMSAVGAIGAGLLVLSLVLAVVSKGPQPAS